MSSFWRRSIWAMVPLVLLALYGCGSSSKDGQTSSSNGSLGTDSAGVAYVGATTCINCHQSFDWSKQYVSDYLQGKHVIHSTHVDASMGPDGCLNCHDPIGDGKYLAGLKDANGNYIIPRSDIPAAGLAAVTCEACHGAGGQHYGTGPIANPTPDFNTCGKCHNSTFFHIQYHPEGGSIVENFINSPHAHSINSHNYVSGSTTDVQALCSRCHTDEGARLYKTVQGGYGFLVNALSSQPAVPNASVVQCRTCHNPHAPDQLLFSNTTDSNGNVTASAEFNTCTNCHQTSDAYHGQNNPKEWSGGSVGSGTMDTSKIIYDTHNIDPSLAATQTGIVGYVIDKAGSRSCRDCHNEHNADTTINKQWANSGHSGYILQTINPSTHMANVTDPPFGGDGGHDFKLAKNGACQRCHTSTGFRNFANGPATYNPANNVFVATGSQKEMIYCWACHRSNAGTQDPNYLRDPGVFVNISPYSTPASRVAAVPDLKGSNICLSCHSGRQTGQFIKDYTGSLATAFSTFNSHYLAAGGVMFRTIGYEFTGANYNDPSYYEHKLIGTSAVSNTGTNGPCVGCHMQSSQNGHTLEIVTRDSSGIINAVLPANDICSNCHTGTYVMTPQKLQGEQAGFTSALAALANTFAGGSPIDPTPIYYSPEKYPYFFSAADFSDTGYTGWQNKDEIGAAFDLHVLSREPGAYAHNRYYAKILIFDSLDYLQHGNLTGTIDLTGYSDAITWYGGDPAQATTVTRP